MRHIKWTDRVKETLNSVKETLNFNRESAIHVALAVVVAIGISAAMIHGIAPSKSIYNADMERMEAGITHIGSNLANLSMDTDTILALWPLATQGDLEAVSDTVTTHTTNIAGLQTRIGNAENRISEVQEDIAALPGSPPEGYLTGTVGNYTLHAECSIAGNYTANVNLVYLIPKSVGNATTQDEALNLFYSGINWAATSVPGYVGTLTYNGNTGLWGISRVSFNIGIFAMAANTETDVGIKFSGLNSTYAPDFAYVEVWPVLE